MTPRTSSAGGSAEALRRLGPIDVVIAGGGTGGHTSPGLAVAALLRERSRTCAWIGSRSGIEAQRVPQSGIPYIAISTGKLRRYWAWQNAADLLVNVPAGTLSVLRILRTLRPRVVFGTGGFVALPVVFGAALLRVPVVLHEQTAIPGLANRIGARFARRIAVTFPDRAGCLPAASLNRLYPRLAALSIAAQDSNLRAGCSQSLCQSPAQHAGTADDHSHFAG